MFKIELWNKFLIFFIDFDFPVFQKPCKSLTSNLKF